jgi:hypothetical protein
MFLDLIKLYHKYQKGSITPLEDFNTEIFANLLAMYPDILEAFLFEFFNLEGLKKLKVNTQQREPISGDRADCIVDLVISSERYIIFIENKVESHEGDEQLDRYTQALHENHSSKIKMLAYCTKYADPKEHIDEHVYFFQFRWYEVARFLETFNQEPVVQSYLEFLSNYKMNQDNTLKTEHLIAYENICKAIEIAEFHIENVQSEFNKYFKVDDKNYKWDQIRRHNRICNYKLGIFPSDTEKGSNVLYGFNMLESKLIAQICVKLGHERYDLISSRTYPSSFKILTDVDGGFVVRMDEDLGVYLNKPNGEEDIKKWFLDSFNDLEKLINSINQS